MRPTWSWPLLFVLAACPPPVDETGDPNDTDDTDLPGPVGLIGAEGGVVASEDGVLTLTIPPGALSEPTEISIAPVDTSAWAAGVAELEPVGGLVYAVEPEGTEFAVPVRFRWTFSTAPAGAFDDQGGTSMVAAMAAAADGALTFHADVAGGAGGSAYEAESLTTHFSQQFLTRYVYTNGNEERTPYGPVTADLNGGRHGIGDQWSARSISWSPGYAVQGVPNRLGEDKLDLYARSDAPVVTLETEDYHLVNDGPFGELARHQIDDFDIAAGATYAVAALPQWTCTAEGAGTISFRFVYVFRDGAAAARFSEPVQCASEKAAYAEAITEVGRDNVAPLGVPDTAQANLDTGDTAETDGIRAYQVDVPAGTTVRVCLATDGTLSYGLYARFEPAVAYEELGDGCIDLVNDDTEDNSVLIVLEGTGNVSVTTSVP